MLKVSILTCSYASARFFPIMIGSSGGLENGFWIWGSNLKEYVLYFYAQMDGQRVAHGVAGAPNESRLLELMERTGYPMIQENGQRKFGPPPGWQGNRSIR